MAMAIKIISNGKGTLLSDSEWEHILAALDNYLDDDNPTADDNYTVGTWDRKEMAAFQKRMEEV